MTLTGVDPFDPTPSDRRELILGAGAGATGSFERTVLLIGNKIGGTETVDALDAEHPILDEADCVARFGRRSELSWMYRAYVATDPTATIYGASPTESAGVAAFAEFTIAGGATAGANSTLEFEVMDRKVQVPVTSGDTVAAVVAAAVLALNDAESSTLPIVATDASPIVRVTHAQKGVRYGAVIGGAGFGVTARFLVPCTLTVTKGALSVGTLEDDGTTLFTSVTNHENYYWVLPWVAAAACTATDNQLGEALANVVAQAAPSIGKDQIICCAFTGTQAQHTTMCTALNSTRCHCYWQEGSDLPASMIAAHCAGVKRSAEVAHPSANIAGYCASDNTPWQITAPALLADRPTATEIKADLNNGGSPIATRPNGKTYLVRDITTRSEVVAGDKDYKAREGHILSATTFGWQLFMGRYQAQKQPFVDDNAAAGQMPKARTTTPDSVRSIMIGVIDDLTSSKPLGIYDGPVLAPSKAGAMKASIVCTKIPAGITIRAELFAVEHNLKSETTFLEVGGAY